jgi:uncharacterized protein YqjF (DUF2071 family)
VALRLDTMIERRLLLNYRADPKLVTELLPAPFRPHLVEGYAVVGLCLLRLGRPRPAGLPLGVGFASENAAHRIAVEWDGPDGTRTGLFFPRRDTASRVNVTFGGWLFPGVVAQRADFDVAERAERLRIAYATHDGSTAVDVEVRIADQLPKSVLFANVEQVSEFFRVASSGYWAAGDAQAFEGLKLATSGWRVDPCVVDRAASSFYDDRSVFPAGSVVVDSAVVMRKVPARWSALRPLRPESQPLA